MQETIQSRCHHPETFQNSQCQIQESFPTARLNMQETFANFVTNCEAKGAITNQESNEHICLTTDPFPLAVWSKCITSHTIAPQSRIYKCTLAHAVHLHSAALVQKRIACQIACTLASNYCRRKSTDNKCSKHVNSTKLAAQHVGSKQQTATNHEGASLNTAIGQTQETQRSGSNIAQLPPVSRETKMRTHLGFTNSDSRHNSMLA